MRRPISALASAVLGTALAASTVTAQMSPPASAPGPGGEGSAPVSPPVTASPSDAPVNPARGARHLLRNGWDYITYQEFERALLFFREAERRSKELNDPERVKLQQGIERAQRGLREKAMGVKGEPAYAKSGGPRRPGSLAMARPIAAAGSLASATAAAPAPASNTGTAQRPAVTARYEPEPIQLAGGGGSNLNLQPATDVQPTPVPTETPTQPLPESEPTPAPGPAPASTPVLTPAPMPAPPETEIPGVPLPNLGARPVPGEQVIRTSQAPSTPPAADPLSTPELPPPPQDLPLPAPAGSLPLPGEPAPSPGPASVSRFEPAPARTPSPNPAPMPAPVAMPPAEDESLVPLPPSLSDRPQAESRAPETAPTTPPAPAPAPVATTPPAPAPAVSRELPAQEPLAGLPGAIPSELPSQPSPMLAPVPEAVAPEAPPARAAEELPSTPPAVAGLISSATTPSTLSPELQEEVAKMAQRQEDELRQRPLAPPPAPPGEVVMPTSPAGSSNRNLEISRAPSPTEARPIKGIPVPEEFVPLPKRDWDPNRKYWAAAATCHLPLYFQDASLERYGYSMEQRFGHAGRYLSYPIDDTRQSKQRNQLIQPMFSMGLFAFQIGMLPYNLIMDPPWEAEYDLGYYRPGDRVPTDVYYLPLTGVGPPLKGKNYGNPPGQSYNQANGPAAFPAPRW